MKKYLLVILSIFIVGCSTSKNLGKTDTSIPSTSIPSTSINSSKTSKTSTMMEELDIVAKDHPQLEQLKNELSGFSLQEYFKDLTSKLKEHDYDTSGKEKFVSITEQGVYIIITEFHKPSQSYSDYVQIETRIATNTSPPIVFSTITTGLFISYTRLQESSWNIYDNNGLLQSNVQGFNTLYELSIRKKSVYNNNNWSHVEKNSNNQNKFPTINYLVNDTDPDHLTFNPDIKVYVSGKRILLTTDDPQSIIDFYKSN